MPAPRKPSNNGRVPLVSLGQGDYRRDYYPEDFDRGRERSPARRAQSSPRRLESELLAAALRYAAFADWPLTCSPVAVRPPSRRDGRASLAAACQGLVHAVRSRCG